LTLSRHRFRVIWGDPFRGFDQIVVEASDADEALNEAHELRRDLPMPRTAFLINGD